LSAGPTDPVEKNGSDRASSACAGVTADVEAVSPFELSAEPGCAARASTAAATNTVAAAATAARFTDFARRRAEAIRECEGLAVMPVITPQRAEKSLKIALRSDQSYPASAPRGRGE
jgi:hypothetical protein